MTIVCNIWMICLELNWIFYDPSSMLQLSQFVWTLRSSVKVVYNNFLLIDATDRNRISSDQKRLFFAVSLYPLSFFANTPFKKRHIFLKSIWRGQKPVFITRPNGLIKCKLERVISSHPSYKDLPWKLKGNVREKWKGV